MTTRTFKVHTDNLGRLCACIDKAMYGVSRSAINEMPAELLGIELGDMVFISERDVSNNALFGPFYVVDDRTGIKAKEKRGCWFNIDGQKSTASELAYWVDVENRFWCLLFDKVLTDRISVVWPHNWKSLNVNLPPWGQISEDVANKLREFALENQEEAQEFLKRHCQ